MNITERILYLIPDAQFMCWENDYNRIIWYERNSKPLPTIQELEAIPQAEIDAKNPIIQRQNDIDTILPSWNEVSTYLDGLTNLADAKVALKKLARVIYWLVKNSKE